MVHVHCELLETHGVKWVYKDDGFLDDPPPPHPRVQEHYSVHGNAKYMTRTRIVTVITTQTFSMTVIRCDRFPGCQKMKAYTHV